MRDTVLAQINLAPANPDFARPVERILNITFISFASILYLKGYKGKKGFNYFPYKKLIDSQNLGIKSKN